MKITNVTIVGDLLPEGMELSSSKDIQNNEEIIGYIKIPYQKKIKKDFKWNVKGYFNKNTDIFKTDYKELIIDNIMSETNFLYQKWEIIPFGIRVGILKFICDDIKYSWIDSLYHIRQDDLLTHISIELLISGLCPKSFIKSFNNDFKYH